MSDIVRSAEEPAGRRREVLRVLKAAAAPMSIVAVADELGVHPNTARFHLDVLVSDGRVERVEPDRRGPGRPPLMFRAVRQMDRGGPRSYRLLAEILILGLTGGSAADRDAGAKALAAGRAWGQRLQSPAPRATKIGTLGPTMSPDESIEHLVGLLDQLGFAPERRESGPESGPESGIVKQVGLRHCPFLELAETRTSVVCPIHLGLMQGALETWKAPVSVDRLDAFVEPDLCLAHLTLQGATR